MDITAIPLDPLGGRNKIITVDHYGPSNYKTGGEVWPSVNPNQVTGGPNSLGEASVINILSMSGVTESGNYVVNPIFGGKGANNSNIKLKWLYNIASLGTVGTEVAASTNLSAEVIRLSVLGG
jgi:hypothetical protein